MEVSSVEKRNIDRRQSNVPVANDRRNGADRRAEKSNTNKNKDFLNYSFEALPQYRRIASIPDKIKAGNTTTALGLASLALINLPEDCRDVVSASKQIKSFFTGVKFEPKYDYTKYQHPFSFFRGTFLHNFADPNKSKKPELAQKILDSDKTLAQTKFGKKIINIFGAEKTGSIRTKIHAINSAKENPIFVRANIYEGTKFGKLTAHAMERTTKWGLVAIALLETPQIAKEFCHGDSISEKAKNGAKQVLKSGMNVALTSAGIGYMGAIGQKLGPFGSLVGMGAGAIIGGYGSRKLQDVIS